MTSDANARDASTAIEADSHAVRRASIVAGIALLAMAVLAGVGRLVVIDGLVVSGDPAETAANVTNAPEELRVGIASLLVVASLDLVVAWALDVVFAPEDRRLSRLAAWFRVAYAAVFAVAISHLLTALDVLTDPTYGAIYTTQRRQGVALAQFETFGDVWTIGLAIFGVHLLLLAVLTYNATYTPNYLAGLLGIAGFGYLVDGLGTVLVSGYAIEVSTVTFVGEVVLIGWLLLEGRRVTLQGTTAADTQT